MIKVAGVQIRDDRLLVSTVFAELSIQIPQGKEAKVASARKDKLLAGGPCGADGKLFNNPVVCFQEKGLFWKSR